MAGLTSQNVDKLSKKRLVGLVKNDMGYTDDDFDFIVMEDGSYHTWEEDTPINTHIIPTESNKLWNVPPPSYIRGVSIGSGEYISFDDNTKPPSFDDGTAPPSFDATSGT